ncbi:MAG: response regulator, partial [Planctomycetaceae bacterium]
MAHILVVDDSAMDRRLVSALLKGRDEWTVSTVTNGVEAMEIVETALPDLVLTDMQMPEMNGLELVQAIKRKFPLTPVVLMTAQGSEALAVQALQLGADSYVPKQQMNDDLLETLERVLTL